MKRKALGFVKKVVPKGACPHRCGMRMGKRGTYMRTICGAPARSYLSSGLGISILCGRHLAMLVRQGQKALEETT